MNTNAVREVPVYGATEAGLAEALGLAELNLLRRALDLPETIVKLRQAALVLLSNASYQNWLAVERFQGRSFKVESTTAASVLHELGLIGACGDLRVQFHLYRGKLFLTDTPSAPGNIQTYPWDDESDAIVGWLVQQSSWLDWADCTIDPMCGAGHHNIALPSTVASRFSFDVNERSVAFTAINGLLNDVSICARSNDIREDLVDAMALSGVRKDARILLMVNSPFGLSPLQGVLPLTSDGGETGAVLAKAAMQATSAFCQQYTQVRLCQLVYTIGNPATGSWYVVDFAKDLFGSGRVNFQLLPERSLWRVSGKKEEPNPMPLAALRKKAFCAFQVKGSREQREEMAEGYDALATRLYEQFDATHLGYGIINVDMT